MTKNFIITGTDTDVGKTVVSAVLMAGLKARYWKPVQSGVNPDGLTDTQTVQKLTGLSDDMFLPEHYIFTQPLSPHRAAEIDGKIIDPLSVIANLKNFQSDATIPLLIEGAGGLMVPMTRDMLQIDFFAKMECPVILVARTQLGTINHTLLSVEALRAREIPLAGIVFNGPDMPDTIRTIAEFSGARILGHIPVLADISKNHLQHVFSQNFKRDDFL
jgi:dethiobiotin synthetase